MNRFDRDIAFSRRFDRQIKMAIGPYVIGHATVEQDTKEATDFVLCTEWLRIACRIRRWSPSYYCKFGDQFTLRSSTRNNTRTELEKILDGWGDLEFYGWGDPQTLRLREWSLIDLNVFRQWYAEAVEAGKTITADAFQNDDGTSGVAFWINQLPAGGLIARGHGLQLHDESLQIA